MCIRDRRTLQSYGPPWRLCTVAPTERPINDHGAIHVQRACARNAMRARSPGAAARPRAARSGRAPPRAAARFASTCHGATSSRPEAAV
eukprot:4051386-Alexandrium_andersonii.AAC.1